MDYKRKYDKLVDAIKVLQETNPSDEGIQSWVNDNVPELKESEDEKIRKEIITILQYKYGKFSKDPKYCNTPQWIAWLEKQGQKPTWSEEDERAFHHVLSVLEEYGEEHPSNSKFVCNWLKSIKARMGGDKA